MASNFRARLVFEVATGHTLRDSGPLGYEAQQAAEAETR